MHRRMPFVKHSTNRRASPSPFREGTPKNSGEQVLQGGVHFRDFGYVHKKKCTRTAVSERCPFFPAWWMPTQTIALQTLQTTCLRLENSRAEGAGRRPGCVVVPHLLLQVGGDLLVPHVVVHLVDLLPAKRGGPNAANLLGGIHMAAHPHGHPQGRESTHCSESAACAF